MKVILNDEAFDYDGASAPMSEAMAVEKESGRSYAEYMSGLDAGALWAFCVLAWIIWRRDGRDVPLQDLLDNKIDFDLGRLLVSFMEGMEEAAAAKTAAEAAGDPTEAGAVPAGTATTRDGMRASSRKSSGSGRGRSAG